MAKATDPVIDPVLPVEPSVEEEQAGLEEVEIGLEEPLVYAASEITKDLLLIKEFTLNSECVLKTQITTLLDQAIQASLVK